MPRRGSLWRAGVEGLVAPADDVQDVLLRHRLLPQADGFEGLGLSFEGAPPDALPAPPPPRVPEQVLERHVTPRPATESAQGRQRHVPEVAHVDNLDVVVREGREHVLPPAAHSFMAVPATLDGGDAGHDFHVVIH
jgi:hypothetical protein